MSTEVAHTAASTEHHVSGPGLHEVFGAVTLLLVGAIFYFGARKGIVEALRSRSQDIKNKLSDTSKRLGDVESKLVRAQKEFSDIENIRQKLLSEAAIEAQKMSDQILVEAKNTAQRILTDAQQSAQNETRKALKELRATLVQSALDETGRIVGGEKNKEVHQKLAQDLVQGV